MDGRKFLLDGMGPRDEKLALIGAGGRKNSLMQAGAAAGKTSRVAAARGPEISPAAATRGQNPLRSRWPLSLMLTGAFALFANGCGGSYSAMQPPPGGVNPQAAAVTVTLRDAPPAG